MYLHQNTVLSTSRVNERGLPGIVFGLLFFACFLIIAVSGNVLAMVGLNYAGSGGNPLEKIHPSTFILLLGCAAFLLYTEGLNRLTRAVTHPSVRWGMLCLPIVIVYTQFFLTMPVATIIVSWFTPFFAMVLLNDANAKQLKLLAYLLYALMAVNSLVGVIEFAQGDALIPPVLLDYTGEGGELDMSDWGEWRASGLFGHPLSSTLACGTLAVALFAKLCFTKCTHFESFTLMHTLAAMPVFGGRTSIFVALFCFFLIMGVRVVQDYAGKSTNRINLLGVMLWAIAAVLALMIAYSAGYFEQFIERLNDDNGSALTRLSALDIMWNTPWDEWLLGDFRGLLFARQLSYGTIYGIEIFWVAMLLTYGLIVNLALYVPTMVMLNGSIKSCSLIKFWPVLFFFLAGSSGVGLAAKSTSLSFLILVLFCISSTHFAANSNAVKRFD